MRNRIEKAGGKKPNYSSLFVAFVWIYKTSLSVPRAAIQSASLIHQGYCPCASVGAHMVLLDTALTHYLWKKKKKLVPYSMCTFLLDMLPATHRIFREIDICITRAINIDLSTTKFSPKWLRSCIITVHFIGTIALEGSLNVFQNWFY